MNRKKKFLFSVQGFILFLVVVDTDQYARKAHKDLIKVRGKNFTKQKNKKKRNTFHGGGRIDIMATNSIVYD